MKIFFAWCFVAIALGMIVLLISSAKDVKSDTNSFLNFLFIWICDSSEIFAILFISLLSAFILFVRANKQKGAMPTSHRGKNSIYYKLYFGQPWLSVPEIK